MIWKQNLDDDHGPGTHSTYVSAGRFIATISGAIVGGHRLICVIELDEPRVGDGDTVGIARQILEHGFWSGKGALSIDKPLQLS